MSVAKPHQKYKAVIITSYIILQVTNIIQRVTKKNIYS